MIKNVGKKKKKHDDIVNKNLKDEKMISEKLQNTIGDILKDLISDQKIIDYELIDKRIEEIDERLNKKFDKKFNIHDKTIGKKENDFDELTDKINKITPNQSQKIEELQEKIDKNKQEVNKTSKKKKSSTDSD